MKTSQSLPSLETAATHCPDSACPSLKQAKRPSLLPPALAEQAFPPLEQVTRSTLQTDAAAYYLNRKSQTLRAWACLENGPIRPVRINGRLAWPVAEIRKLLTGGQ